MSVLENALIGTHRAIRPNLLAAIFLDAEPLRGAVAAVA